MNQSNHIWHLMALCLSNEAGPEQQRELMFHLESDPSLRQKFELMQAVLSKKPPEETVKNDIRTAKVARILQLAEFEKAIHSDEPTELAPAEPARKPYKRAIMLLAPVLALVICWFFYQENIVSPQQKDVKTVIADKGSRSRTILPDGSTVWLNSDSKLSFNFNTEKKIREVFLEGEAFFDVAKQKDRPFIVHTSGIDIKVLGTAFNVKDYQDEHTIETTLIRGLVQITNKDETKQAPVLLRPHQKLIFNKPSGSTELAVFSEHAKKAGMDSLINRSKAFVVTPLDSSIRENERIETAWVYNRLEFKGLRFGELARKLERSYKVSIHFKDDSVKDLCFNGSFENETIEEAFTALKAAVPFNYSIDQNEIYVSSAK